MVKKGKRGGEQEEGRKEGEKSSMDGWGLSIVAFTTHGVTQEYM